MYEVGEKCSDSIRASSKILTICQKSLHFSSSLLQDTWENRQHLPFVQIGKHFFPQYPQNMVSVSAPPPFTSSPRMSNLKHSSSFLEETANPVKTCVLVLLKKGSLRPQDSRFASRNLLLLSCSPVPGFSLV